MSRALFTLLIAFCCLSWGYGEYSEKEVLCNDADTCETLQEVKDAAIIAVNETAEEQLLLLNKIRESSFKIQEDMLENEKIINQFYASEWTKAFEEGNRAFMEAIQQGKELSVFECIVDCELSSRKAYSQVANKSKHELSTLQENFNKSANAVLVNVEHLETNCNETLESYIKKINSAITKITVTWNRDQAFKAFANIAKDIKKLSENFDEIISQYKDSTQTFIENCGKEFMQVTEDVKKCDNGCLQN